MATYNLGLKPVTYPQLRAAAIKQAIKVHGQNAVFTDNVMDGLMFNVLKHDYLLVDGVPYDAWVSKHQWTLSYKELAEQLPDFVRNNGLAFLWRVAKSRASFKQYANG